MIKDYNEIIKEINKKSFDHIYFLQGEEPFFIDDIIKQIESQALNDTEKSLNQLILYGKETNLVDVIGRAKSYPMMGDRQVIIVKEAQEMKDWTKTGIQMLLISYLENPLLSTILVFGYKYKTIDKRTKLGKIINKKATCLHAKKLYDNQLPNWISFFCKNQDVQITNDAIMMLSENIGNNLQRLANEINKLLLNATKENKIDALMVQQYVGISKEYNIFELQKALSNLNKEKAYKIVNYFSSNTGNNPLVLIIYNLFSYFSKLLLIHHTENKNEQAIAHLIGVNPFFVKEYMIAIRNYSLNKVAQNIKYIHETDLQSKGIGVAIKKESSILIELIYKLMN